MNITNLDLPMNPQYFGDTRDLFKFDLIRHIMKSLPDLGSCALVPMLTGTEVRGGRRKSVKKDLDLAFVNGKPGTRNQELFALMEKAQAVTSHHDYFSGIGTYFEREQIATEIFYKVRFSHECRDNYFRHMLSHVPARSLVFLDPDTGLEESTPGERHLLFSEVRSVHDTMDEGSVLMIYQHFPRVNRKNYLRSRCSQLSDITGSPPAVITDNEIVFFLIAKNPALRVRLSKSIGSYADSYPDLTAYSCA